MNYIQFNKDTNEYNYSFPYHKLKKYRLENFLSKDEMANKIGIGVKTYSRLELGNYFPKKHIHVKNAKAIYEFIKKEQL